MKAFRLLMLSIFPVAISLGAASPLSESPSAYAYITNQPDDSIRVIALLNNELITSAVAPNPASIALCGDTAIITRADEHKITPIPAIVLNFELLGDTSIVSLKLKDQFLIKHFSEKFRQLLKQQSVFDVIDDKQSLALLEKESEHRYLHRCNGCELDLAKQLGAKVVVVPWVFRMSVLIQTMHIEIREAKTGAILMKKPYDFRGNSDQSWERSIRYIIKDLKQYTSQIQQCNLP